MTDKPALMSREEIAGWADCILGNPSALTENTRERQEFGEIVKAALAAHDIYDKAIEDAAQVVITCMDAPEHSEMLNMCRKVVGRIRCMEGTSNG